jgi:outer membrane protein assembly factor BamA
LSGTVAYPFNKSQRIEVSGGLLNIGYDSEVRMRTFSPDGREVEDITQQLPARPTLSLGTASLALVYDASFWGWTSPVLGQRYRLEVGSILGSIDMYSVLIDFRKYLMPVRPFTLAFRVQHAGRYGPDADRADQIQPQFIGWDGVVRGYSGGSFDFAVECGGGNQCTSYNELFGSSTIVANVELRFPPAALIGGNSGLFGFLPIEALVFGDAGMAYWGTEQAPLLYATSGDARPWFLGGDRKMLYSAGVGIRMNVFGIMIMELDYVYPFSRQRGGHIQFGFTPGF